MHVSSLSLQLFSEKKEDQEKYQLLTEQIRNNIIKKYLVPGTGKFDNATQAAQIFALYYGLSPEPEKTFQVLLDEYARHNWHISTGIFACKMGFDVLREHNRNDIAYRLVNQRDYPGWGYMVENGATTLWESWEYPENASSQNHPMFGSTEEWFYRSLLGINPLQPGFKEIMIKPQPAGDLKWVQGSYHSMYGLIRSAWRITEKEFQLEVEIPANTTARIYLPATNQESIACSSGYTYAGEQDGYSICLVNSGKYTFTCQ
ncbi:MAG: hypothetical protein LUG51_01550 [Tannerellaceae bacterium]|nr:hypothetical protein [Tannerellaceae bacterium]